MHGRARAHTHTLDNSKQRELWCSVKAVIWKYDIIATLCLKSAGESKTILLTVSSRGRLSLTAPTQPRQPITMMIVPTAMSRLAADREGRDDDRVAKFPWVTESQTPTPRMPHPPNCSGNTNRCKAISVLAVQANMVKSKVFTDMLLFST